MDILLIFACLYMAVINVQSLAKIPFAEWEVIQYAMAVLTVLLVLVGGLKGWQFYNKKRAKKEEAAKKALEEQAARLALPDESEKALFAQTEEPTGRDPDDWEAETAEFNYTLLAENPEKKDDE